MRFVERSVQIGPHAVGRRKILQIRSIEIRPDGSTFIADWQDVPLVIEELELPKGICVSCGQITKFEDNVCGNCRNEPIA